MAKIITVDEVKIVTTHRYLVVDGERLIKTPELVLKAYKQYVLPADWYTPDKEHFVQLILDCKYNLTHIHLVTMGLHDQTLLAPIECFRMPVLLGSSFIILVHNHPTGDTTPSAEDVRITNRLLQAGAVLDIKILDHIIIGLNNPTAKSETLKEYTSLRESGLVDFGNTAAQINQNNNVKG